MNSCLLSLRISRRAIGAAILEGESLSLSDGRHLPSTPDRAKTAAVRYVERLLTPAITAAIVDAPGRGISATSDAVFDQITDALRSRGLSVLTVVKGDVLAAYGVAPLPTRGDVRTLVAAYWPNLDRLRGAIKPYAMDAAAAALYGECQVTLSPQAP